MGWWPFARKSTTEGLSPEVKQIFDRAIQFLDDEAPQNSAMHRQRPDTGSRSDWLGFACQSALPGKSADPWRRCRKAVLVFGNRPRLRFNPFWGWYELVLNAPCEQVPNSFGEFGRTTTNPVPVNGPIGELIYLSRLEAIDGSPIAFHRLGAFGDVDIFELVLQGGRGWDLLYLSMYYSRKSSAAPRGYRMTDDKARRSLIRGTTATIEGFPKGIFRAAIECTERMLGIPISDSWLKTLEGSTRSSTTQS
jgi:hypothetical protein